MKLFDARFFGGALVVGLGVLGLVIGLSLLLPLTGYSVAGVILILVGAFLMTFGFKFTKDAPPAASKTAIDILRQAGIINKNYKK